MFYILLSLIFVFIIMFVHIINHKDSYYAKYSEYLSKMKPVLQIVPATKEECLLLSSTYNVIPNQLDTLNNLPYNKKTQWIISDCNSVLLNNFVLEGKFKLSGNEIFEKYSGQSVYITIDQNGVSQNNVPPCLFSYDLLSGNISYTYQDDTTKKYYGKVIDKNSFYIETNSSSTLYSRIL